MKTLALFLVLVASAMGMDVLELTDADFDSTVESHDTMLVMFYAPWCGHCKRMKPEFEKAATILMGNDPPVAMGKVDCTEAGKETCGRFSVSGYPTLKIFRGIESYQDYNGPREVDGIVKYMKAQVGPASKELKSDADLEKLLEKEAVVCGALADSDDMKVFKKVADSMREKVAFAHSEKPVKKQKGVVLFRAKHLQTKMEPSEVVYDGKMDAKEITKWINENYHGLVGHRTLDSVTDFKDPLVVAYYDVDYVKNPKGTNYWRNRVMKVAKNFKDLNFAVSNENDFQRETEEFGMETITQDKPMVALKSNKGKFVMEDEFSVESFEKFLKDYEAGKLEPYMKSEPIPEKNDGPVKVAVAKNFEELVMKSDKDVLIEFYAPWCGHCKKLAPIYDELGEKMSDEMVEIVKMDATGNDVPPNFDVRGFPTIFWVPADTKKPESYDGGRGLEDFIKYIAKKSTTGLKNFDKNGKAVKTEL